jgi:hypothetical protein
MSHRVPHTIIHSSFRLPAAQPARRDRRDDEKLFIHFHSFILCFVVAVVVTIDIPSNFLYLKFLSLCFIIAALFPSWQNIILIWSCVESNRALP